MDLEMEDKQQLLSLVLSFWSPPAHQSALGSSVGRETCINPKITFEIPSSQFYLCPALQVDSSLTREALTQFLG